MPKLRLLLFALIVCSHLYGQKTETFYLSPKDSSSNLYIVVSPTTTNFKGFLFLIPGMFQKPQDVLVQTDLPKHAAQQGILTIIPTFRTGISSFGVDTATQASLLELLSDVKARFHLDNKRFFLGGFSIGGSCALKYAELAFQNNFPIKPSAVFAIDAPLDFERLYKSMQRELRFPGTGIGIQEENNYMLKRFEKVFGGSPTDALTSYRNLSPYSFNDTTQTAIKPLVNLPIRLYTEPDVQWWLEDGLDYSGMNAFDFAAMTNELRRLGSKTVTLVTTTNKGYRKPDNKRHPHSWSIVEPIELVNWLLAQT